MVDRSRGRVVKSAIFLSLLFAAPAWAQDEGGGLGLDLTEEEKPPAPEQPPAEAPPADTTTATAAETPAADAQGLLDPIGERDITQDDRVKAVQRKVYLKNNRFEVTPMIAATINDPYYLKWGGVLRVAYYLADTLAIVGRGSVLQTLQTNDAKIAKRIFQSKILYSVPFWTAMGDVEWSPIYGKVAIFNNILHFDAYLLGGIGAVVSETSFPPSGGLPTPSPAMDIGGGLRFVAKDWLAVNASLVNTAYVDVGPRATTKGATQNMLAASAGISIFFPFSSTGREAE